VPVCDLVCGLYAALAVVSALRARDRDGEGQHIDVSLFEAGVSLAVWEAGKYFATGEVGRPLGSAHQTSAPYQAFRTSDGWVTVGAVTPKTWQAFCRILGLERLLDDERYSTAYERRVQRDELIPAIEAAIRTWSSADLIDALDDAGVPCAPIADYAQVFTDEHLVAREFYWRAPHPRIGSVEQIGSPMRLSATPAIRRAAGPLLGADTDEVLGAAGFSVDDIDEFRRKRAVA